MAEKAYELGKKLGARAAEVTPEERDKAKARLAWSRAQRDGEDHRTEVQKGE